MYDFALNKFDFTLDKIDFALDKFDDPKYPKSWLIKIAKYVITNYIKDEDHSVNIENGEILICWGKGFQLSLVDTRILYIRPNAEPIVEDWRIINDISTACKQVMSLLYIRNTQTRLK